MSTSLPTIPADLAGWTWRHTTDGGALLEAPDGWQTRAYTKSVNKAIGEARRRVLSQPKPAPADTLSPEVRAYAEDALAQAQAFIGRAQAAQQAVNELGVSPPATAWQPGPDAQGMYRRPPDQPERQQLAPQLLLDGRWQPRTAYPQEALDELTESVREHGVLEELLALVNEAGEVELITGHRRKRAAIAAGLLTVPVKILEVTLAQATEIAIISNDQRTDLTDLERGQAYEKMIAELGISEAELARRLSRPRAYIQQRRMIAGAAPDLQKALVAGHLSFTQARAICLGSGGHSPAQVAALKQALSDAKDGRPTRAEDLQRRAERAILELGEDGLKKLGWKMCRTWVGNTPRVFWYAPTAAPAEWSSAEILAAVKEAKHPPAEKPTIAQLGKEDLLALERRGWPTHGTFAPWPAVERDGAYVFGEQAIAAAAQARADVAALVDRFEAQGWTVTWKYGSTLIAKLAKPKREESCYGWQAAIKLIGQIEKGKLPPPSSSGGHTYRPTCEICRHKTAEYKSLDGKTVCPTCAPPIEARLAQERAAIAQALEAQAVPAWLSAAPAFVADLLLVQHFRVWLEPILGINRGYMEAEQVDEHVQTLTPAQRGAALRVVAEGLAWDKRPTVTARYVAPPPLAEGAATAVAAPAPPTPAEPLTYAQIVEALGGIEERWAGGQADDDDAALLEQLADGLEDLAEELSDDEYEGAIGRIGRLLARLDEEEAPHA